MRLPNDEEIELLWKKYGTPDHVIDHSRRVDEAAHTLLAQLSRGELLHEDVTDVDFFLEHADFSQAEAELEFFPTQPFEEISEPVLHAAALLHDIVRPWKHHEEEGGRILTEEGYPELGWIIARHSNFPEADWLSPFAAETALLYMADKQISGTKPVSIESRYMLSREKLQQRENAAEALFYWEQKYRQAAELAAFMQLHALANQQRRAAEFCK